MSGTTNADGLQARTLEHFATFALSGDYWRLAAPDQAELRGNWARAFNGVGQATHHYVTFPLESRSDILLWCSAQVIDDASPSVFFDAWAHAFRPFRRYLSVVDALWGFTRGSDYSSARSRQAIDPLEKRTQPYLIVYPFTKTSAWYLLDRDTRQAQMNDHIRIGKRYREITQLLAYSTGLQDQEFVVVYETADLHLFSRLVSDLRQTEARHYTKADTPVHTALLRDPADPDNLWP